LYNCDGRDAPLIDSSIDLILTSPPYLNAIDYIRCSKFSLVWMGHKIEPLRRLRSSSVGSEVGITKLHQEPEVQALLRGLNLRPKLDCRDEAMLARYVFDMRKAINEAARIVTKKGKIIYVVGENTIKGTYIANASILVALARDAGLKLDSRTVRKLPPNRRYLPPPSNRGERHDLNSRMRREVVLTFSRKK
jgi:DNA modification methylase